MAVLTTLLELPLFGSFSVPLFIAVITLLSYCFGISFEKSKKTDIVPEVQAQTPEVSTTSSKRSIKKTQKKKCCGKSKKNGSDTDHTSTDSKDDVIDITKIFIDGKSQQIKELGVQLTNFLSEESLVCEVIDLFNCNNIGETLQNETKCTSLCAFLVDVSSESEFYEWIKSTSQEKSLLLSGMKYTVFAIEPPNTGGSNILSVDQRLHKLGAVRVCRAGTSQSVDSSEINFCFEEWCNQVVKRIAKWNYSSSKSCKCKCSPKLGSNTKKEGSSSCSGNSSHSGSDTEHAEEHESGSLDMEDMAYNFSR